MFNSFRNRVSGYSWYPWLIFISVTTATFMVNVDSSILNIALPVLEDEFSVGPQTLQWVITGYLLIITGVLPTVGKLSDLRGRKGIFIIGLVVFTIGSIFSAISTTIIQLIAYRVIQGIGGAIMQANVMSIIAYTFPPGSRGKAMGLIGSVVAAGTIAGPSVGGFLIDQFGWPSIFWVNVPIGLVGMIGSYILLPSEDRKKAGDQFDYFGSITFFVATISLLLFFSNIHTWGWKSLITLSYLLISVIGWISFIVREAMVSDPLIELSLFKNPVFTIGNITGLSSYALMMFPSILLPLFLHNVTHLEILQIGFLMTSQAVTMLIVSPISGWLADRIGYDLPSLVGMGLSAVGLWLMGNFNLTTSRMDIIIALILFGIGMGFFQSPNNVAVIESVPVEKTGVTGGIIATVRNFGRVFGAALAIFLLQIGLKTGNAFNQYANAVSFVFYFGSGFAFINLLLILGRSVLAKRGKNYAMIRMKK
ncbi:MAG: MFS transporter [Tepidibacillus sp.]